MSYGVLWAGLDRWEREDKPKSPHLQIRAVEPGGRYARLGR
ncbi:hypothetical protein [Dactylosporangium sp. CA-092794]